MRLIPIGLENCRTGRVLNSYLRAFSPREEKTDYTLPAQLAASLRMASPSNQTVEGRLRPEFLLTTQALAGFLLSLKTIGIKVLPTALLCETEGSKQTFIRYLLYDGPTTGAFIDLSSVHQL